MQCPKGHGEMYMYKDNVGTQEYRCNDCPIKLELNTTTGKVIQIAGGLAVLGTAVWALFEILGNSNKK